MLDAIDEAVSKGGIALVIVSILAIFVSGLFFAGSYYIMDTVETAFEGVNCEIDNNLYFDNCQEMFDLSIYPFLALKSLLIWASFFFIFALTLGLLVTGYKSGTSPVMLGVMIVFVSILTYASIEISNVYRTMVENATLRSMMTEFTVYNKLMLNFPWFIFIVSLMSVMLGIVNYQRTKVNTANELDY